MKKKTLILIVISVIVAFIIVGLGFFSSGHKEILRQSLESMTEGVENNAAAMPVGQTFIRKAIVYTYNNDSGQYEKYGTMNMYNDENGNLLIGNDMPVHENRDIQISFRYWAVDEWETYYYFN